MIQKVVRDTGAPGGVTHVCVFVCDGCHTLSPEYPIAELADDEGVFAALVEVTGGARGWRMSSATWTEGSTQRCPRCAPTPPTDSPESTAVVSAVDGAGDPTPAEEVSHGVTAEGGGHGEPSGHDEAQTEAAAPCPPPDDPAPTGALEEAPEGSEDEAADSSVALGELERLSDERPRIPDESGDHAADVEDRPTETATSGASSSASEPGPKATAPKRARRARPGVAEPVIIGGEPTFASRPALSSAVFSPCLRYRYRLSRGWELTLPRVLFVMLNPSIADEKDDDQTMRKCIGFAKRWGFGSLDVGNLFGWISTDPKGLRGAVNPIGETDAHVLEMAREASWVVLAWGRHGSLYGRGAAMRALLAKNAIPVLGLPRVKNGEPSHPLMLPYTTTPEPW